MIPNRLYCYASNGRWDRDAITTQGIRSLLVIGDFALSGIKIETIINR